MHVFGSKKPSASQIRAGFFPIIRDDEKPKTDTYDNLIIFHNRALVGGGARGAVAPPPTFWEMKYFLPQKIMTVETKSSTTYSGPLTV